MQVVKIIEGDMTMKQVHGLLVRDWKEDIVNLVQYPRCHTIVNPSPFSLKLETWLRMNGIKYYNVSNELTKGSSKGQVPFIEHNGRQFADSNFIIEHLRNHFKLPIDGNLTTEESAQSRAFTVLIEESLFRILQYERSKNFEWIATDRGYLPLMAGYQKFLFKKILLKQLQNRLKKTLNLQGYGRHSEQEIEEIAKKDLNALSTQLGSKPFMFGDDPSTIDATLFGHLAQFIDTPLHSDKIKPFIEESTPNLVEFVKRMKERYWPDWEEICEKLWLNPEDAKKAAEQEAAKLAAEKEAVATTNVAAEPNVAETPQTATAGTESVAVVTTTTFETTKVTQEG